MSIYTRARADDVRALAGAIVLGSSVGLALGGACLLGGNGRQAVSPTGSSGASVQAAASSAPAAKTPAGVAPAPSGLAALLRDRFRLGAPAGPPAAPFAFAKVAEAPSDLNCLAETVYFEARGEPVEGQKAVAQVVLNRVRHPAFPKTICGVVRQRTASGCQFAFACAAREPATGSLAWRRARTVASAALHGAVMAAVGDATHFQTARSGPFAGLLKVAQIGAHAFYRFAGHGGAAGMFHQAPAPSAAPARIELAMIEPVRIEPARLEPAAKGAPPASLVLPAVSAPTTPSPSVKPPVLAVKLATIPPTGTGTPAPAHGVAASPASTPLIVKTPPVAPSKPATAAPALTLDQS